MKKKTHSAPFHRWTRTGFGRYLVCIDCKLRKWRDSLDRWQYQRAEATPAGSTKSYCDVSVSRYPKTRTL